MIIFILELENNKYFIGGTDNIQNFIDSIENTDIPWLKLHKYKEVSETFEGEPLDIDKMVLKYMSIYGIESVRGGIYSNIKLPFDKRVHIRSQLFNSEGRCTACGSLGHKLDFCNTPICYKCARVGHYTNTCVFTDHSLGGSNDCCYRCGRGDHYAFRCNRSEDIYGRKLNKSCIIS